MINQVYQWFFDFFFSGELPAVLAPIAEELCAVMSLLFVALCFAPAILLIIFLVKFLGSFARW